MNAEAGQLRSFVTRAERLHEERKANSDDLSELFKEAKGVGYDVKILKTVIRRRADPDATAEADAILDTYEAALAGTRTRGAE